MSHAHICYRCKGNPATCANDDVCSSPTDLSEGNALCYDCQEEDMPKQWKEPIPFEDRIDKIVLTGIAPDGGKVSITLLPEEVEYIRRDGRDSDACTHLEVCHSGEMAYGCDIPDCGCGDGQGI